MVTMAGGIKISKKIYRLGHGYLYIQLIQTEYTLRLRPGRVEDTDKVGKIIFEAFSAIADKHNFPPDFPSVDAARDLAFSLLSNPRFYSVVAEDTTSSGDEDKDQVVGSNFLDERKYSSRNRPTNNRSKISE
jgi:hypothetical protein